MDANDELVNSLPIRFSDRLSLQVHQFPLLSRPLQPPPSAVASGKHIRARIKPGVRRLEVHVPADVRPEVWNVERGYELGSAQVDDDREKNQGSEIKDDRPRLSEIRLQSEAVKQNGVHMLGLVRNGELHLHPIYETHQFRPTLTYLDFMSRKNRRRGGADSDSDEDDGPPADPDEPVAPVPKAGKRGKKATEAKEVTVAAKKADEKSMQTLGNMSSTRRDMIIALRAEEDEEWQQLEYNDVESAYAGDEFGKLFSQQNNELDCHTNITTYLKSIEGL